MGQYYRTASVAPIDYMYQANTPLMEKVVEANDGFIDQNVNTLDKIGDLADYNHIIGDDEDARQIQQGYQSKVDELTKAIQEDPANWRKHIDPIRALSRDIQDNYKNGAISKQLYNYNQRKTAYDNIEKQVELYHKSGGTKGIDSDSAAAYKAYWDSQFNKTGYDPSTGAYNVYKGGAAMDNMDIKKILSDGLEKLKADKTKEWHSNPVGNDWYIDTATNEKVEVTPQRVLQIATDNLNNPQLSQYLRERSKVGLLKGIYDGKGNFINPYSFNKTGLSQQEELTAEQARQQIEATIKNPAKKAELLKGLEDGVNQLKQRQSLDWNNDSYLAPILRGIVSQYSHSETTQGNTLTNNAKGAAIFHESNNNYRQGQQLAQQRQLFTLGTQRMKDLQQNGFTEKEKMWDKEKQWELDHPKGTKVGTATGASAGAKTNVIPKETGVTTMPINDLNDWLTTDKNNVTTPVLSNNGLSAKIIQSKKELDNIDGALKLPQSEESKAALVKRRQLAQNDLDNFRKWYQTADSAALSGHPAAIGSTGTPLSPEEVSAYKKYDGENNPNVAKYIKQKQDLETQIASDKLTPEELQAIRKQKLYASDEDYKAGKQLTGGEAESTYDKLANIALGEKQKNLKDQLINLNNEYGTFQTAKGKVNKYRDNFLKDMRTSFISSKAINFGTKDSKDVADMILANPTQVKIYDTNGNSVDNQYAFGDNDHKLTFNGEAGKGIDDYLRSHPEAKMSAIKVANSNILGDGNGVVQVQFDGVKNAKPLYLTLTPELRKQIATKFSSHSNAEVAGIANEMTDDFGNNVRRQIMSDNPSLNKTLGVDLKEDGTKLIYLPSPDGSGSVPLEITKLNEGNSQKLIANVVTPKGKKEPLQRSDNGIAGHYSNIEDFIASYKQQIANYQAKHQAKK